MREFLRNAPLLDKIAAYIIVLLAQLVLFIILGKFWHIVASLLGLGWLI
jgi:hypothetical protein